MSSERVARSVRGPRLGAQFGTKSRSRRGLDLPRPLAAAPSEPTNWSPPGRRSDESVEGGLMLVTMRAIGAVVANALALLATTVVPGISFSGSALQLLLAGAIFGLFNLVVRPVAMFLSL